MLSDQQADFYNILQVHHDAEKDVIDAAYKCLSKMYHPDLNRAPAAAERMKDINVAYQVVGNEASRREYHKVWMRNNAWKTLSDREAVGWRAAENKEVFSAYETLDSFFRETLNEKWEDAYGRLTVSDRDNVSFQEFFEWKKAVHAVYRLGNYNISYFRRYHNCVYGEKTYAKIFHFIVHVTELQLVTGQIAESSSHKYVALDGGAPRVCLGNRDLKPITEKFRQLARMVPKEDVDAAYAKSVNRIDAVTGALTREGWIEEAEKELRRSRRYGSPFCVGVIGFAPKLAEGGALQAEETLEKNMAYVSEFLTTNIRTSDVLGRYADLALALLFPETSPRDGRRALEKLVRLLREDRCVRDNFPCQISAMIKKPSDEDVRGALEILLKKAGVSAKPIK
jgi:curved DNA-binding protein CbpA